MAIRHIHGTEAEVHKSRGVTTRSHTTIFQNVLCHTKSKCGPANTNLQWVDLFVGCTQHMRSNKVPILGLDRHNYCDLSLSLFSQPLSEWFVFLFPKNKTKYFSLFHGVSHI